MSRRDILSGSERSLWTWQCLVCISKSGAVWGTMGPGVGDVKPMTVVAAVAAAAAAEVSVSIALRERMASAWG